MSYAVVRVQKMTRGAIKGIEIHDRREKDHSLTNPDIDFSKSGENYDLCPAQNESFSEAVQRRIEQLDLKRAVRKDAVLMAQVIVTSDGAFFDGLKDVDEDAYNAWAERRASCSHEAYISGVPFTEDYIGGLSDSPPMQADRSRQTFWRSGTVVRTSYPLPFIWTKLLRTCTSISSRLLLMGGCLPKTC